MREEFSGGREVVVTEADDGDANDADAAAAAARISSSIFSIRGALTARQLIRSMMYLWWWWW
jgi:predicted alternative tryptophan synthase beta-subunit